MNTAVNDNKAHSSKFLGWEVFKPQNINISDPQKCKQSTSWFFFGVNSVDVLVLTCFISYIIYDISDDISAEKPVLRFLSISGQRILLKYKQPQW